MDDLKEKIADAIEGAQVGYQLRLTSLVDGVSTYTLTYDDELGNLTFDCIDDGYAHIAARKRARAAELALQAIESAGYSVRPK